MKIYDAFQFFNELELLEIRLEELYSSVDAFILCESTKTHSNKDKPLYFLENKQLFSKYQDKIIHHIFEPKEYPYAWYIENEQRNQLKNAKFDFKEGDIFLLSDGDEIMKAESVNYIRKNPSEFTTPKTSIMQMSYNFINTVIEEPCHHKGWRGTVILPFKSYHEISLNEWRTRKDSLERYENSGWHLSFLGGAERIKQKIESYAHQEFNTEEYTNLQKINERLKTMKEPLNRQDFKFKIETDLGKFPKSCLKFKNLFI